MVLLDTDDVSFFFECGGDYIPVNFLALAASFASQPLILSISTLYYSMSHFRLLVGSSTLDYTHCMFSACPRWMLVKMYCDRDT